MAKQSILIVAMLFLSVLAKADTVWITTGESDGSMVSGGLIGHDIGYLSPHAWTETGTVDTPEPGSLLLLGAGLTGLALAISLQKSLG
jgi:hypothetical protein